MRGKAKSKSCCFWWIEIVVDGREALRVGTVKFDVVSGTILRCYIHSTNICPEIQDLGY